MTRRAPLAIAEGRTRASKRLEASLTSWAVDGGAEASVSLPMHPPTERDVLADWGSVRDWMRSWDGIDGVVRVSRNWPSVGRNEVPERLELVGAEAVVRFVGGASARTYRVLAERAPRIAAAIGDSPDVRDALRRVGRAVAALDEADVERLIGATIWLIAHPDSGHRPRQLPVRGIDTKWIERHRGILSALVSAATGRTGLGLVEADVRVRLRMLDPTRAVAGMDDIELPVAAAAALELRPQHVLVVENLTTLLTLPALPGTVAIHGGGFGAGARIAQLPWCRNVDLVYWGDLDSHGFAILHEFRAAFPAAPSLLMDAETLRQHEDLTVPEPSPTRASLPSLTAVEADALSLLRAGGDARLEQERLFWPTVVEALTARFA